jgi:two-component system response regulator YesN
MYKILLADDERIIRDGIKRMIDWKALDLKLIGPAVNGREAYELIQKANPEIVITDVKMPGLSGLDLIKRVKRKSPDTFFIILSGYDEFDFARKAMKYGVKHYILKPSDEEEIISVLREVIAELERQKAKQHFLAKVKSDYQKMLPLVKEQFLRDCIMHKIYTKKEFEYYRSLLKLNEDRIQLIMLQLEESYYLEELLALKRICEEHLEDMIILATIAKDTVLCLIRSLSSQRLIDRIKEIQETFTKFYGSQITASLSKTDSFNNIYNLYSEAKEYMGHKFYVGKGSIITANDIRLPHECSKSSEICFDTTDLVVSIKCGDKERAKKEGDLILQELKVRRMEKNSTIAYLTELLIKLIRQSNSDEIDRYLDRIVSLKFSCTIQEAERIIRETIADIADSNFEMLTKSRNRLIQLVIQNIEKNIGNGELSLKWLAENMVYANVDYLSKLFKKETGEKFSHYVKRRRVEKAEQLLQSVNYERVCEVAENVGFGDNSQYFSQVFKKQTGLTPTEYRARFA